MHPLGGCFGKGCKVAYGANFIIDKKGKQPKDDVMDLQGHGTHVAGIVAANDTSFIGVTPHATLGAYRVFSCDFTVGNDVIIKAMIRAVEDGMDVINMSLGAPSNWRQEREARVVDMLTRNSTLIFVIAAGNEGSMGVFDIALPGTAQSAITVVSMEISIGAVTSSPSVRLSRMLMSKEQRLLVQLSPGTSAQVSKDGCSPIKQGIRGKIALLQGGGCSDDQKMTNVQKAGGTAAIFKDNVPNTQGYRPSLNEEFKINYMGISMADGEYLLWVIQANNTQHDLFVKPDIAAPGGRVWSTYPMKMGKYLTFSGTSMSMPYIAGCIALYLERHPGPADTAARTLTTVRTAFQNSSRLLRNPSHQPYYKGYASVVHQGSRFINLWSVLNNPAIVSPSMLSLNDTANILPQHHPADHKYGEEPVTYRVDIIPAAGLLPFHKNTSINVSPDQIATRASIEISQRLVTVAPGEHATGHYKEVPVFGKSFGLQVVNVDSKPITKGHNEDKGKGDIYIVYKLVTGAKILVVDLVSPTGSDPQLAKSFSVIKGGVTRSPTTLCRCSPGRARS
ncbi:hypothetical protein BGZ52_003008 [Haplosporangium bisporale]|nr:hypothetical protein BGZ52_003008 [Haplosporangium bisporale]